MTDRAAPDGTSLARRLAALERAGADRFDPVATGFVADLLARAVRLGGRAKTLLEARADGHLTRLEDAHRAACDRARRALGSVSSDATGSAAADALGEALDAGDPLTVLRGVRRLRASQRVETPRPRDPHRRYRAALAELQTTLATRPERVVDASDTGLLNGTRLAARILAEAESISPAWRRSLVASLFDLASLMHLPEPPAPRRRR